MSSSSGRLEPVPPPAPALTVAAVARRLGVAPATLRTWDRRYGLGPGAHTAGAHRRYSPTDLARLEVMRRLTLEGVSPGDAARAALAAQIAEPRLATVTEFPTAQVVAEVEPERSGRPAGGGRVVPLAESTPAGRGLARAALALDSQACTDIVSDQIAQRGVTATWDQLCVPVLVGLGQRWAATGQGVEVEHLLSDAVLAALRLSTARIREPANPRPVLLACAEEEQHVLPLHALAAALSERRVAARVLGARVPRDALAVGHPAQRTSRRLPLVGPAAHRLGRPAGGAAGGAPRPAARARRTGLAGGPAGRGGLHSQSRRGRGTDHDRLRRVTAPPR